MDLDGDGDLDLLSGSWPGELFFFEKKADGTYASPIELQDENGDYINIGGGIEERDDEILITGNARFVTEGEQTFAVYHGKRIENTAEKSVAITGTASTVHACDWDADGDMDLLVGDIGGNVYLIPNLAVAEEGAGEPWEFGRSRRLRAGNSMIRVGGDAGPFAADWDGDGDLDLLVGDGEGTVSLFVNEGTRSKPKLATAEVLVQGAGYRESAPEQPACGQRVKVCATDWNGDGKLDLLMGDYATLKPALPEYTAAQQQAHAVARAELEGLYGEYGTLVDKLHGSARVKDEGERDKLMADLTKLQERMSALQDQVPPEEESHGWIWFFARR